MLSRQEEMEERRQVVENERRVRDQGSTYLAHTHNDIGGRFAAISSPVVVGSESIPKYPAGSDWCADPGSQMLEPPLPPHDNPALEPSDLEPSSLSPAQGDGGDPDAPSNSAMSMSKRGSPSFSPRTYRRA